MQRSCAGLKEVRYGKAWLQASILFSLTWSIGGVLDSESRVKFDTFVRSLLTGKNESYPYPATGGRWECHLPADGTLYDYVYEYKQRGQWRQWSETIRNEVIPEDKPLKELIIPTVDTARFIKGLYEFFFSGFYGILRGSFGIFCNYPNMLMESLEYLKDSLKFYGIAKVC